MSIAAPDIDLNKVDLMNEDLFEEGPPHELFARLRTEAPVIAMHSEEAGDYWSVTKAADISEVS
jgi:cholest-4-en-3-one 26-monooxygenase